MAADRFPPISEYGFLSDCHTSALVAPDGSVEWLCLPRFDSPSVFGAMLDRGAGHFRLGPTDLQAPLTRRYEPGTNILETIWMTPTGWVVVRDALTIGEWHPSAKHDRPPADQHAEHVLVRTVHCVQGEVELEMVCEPAFAYGTERPDWKGGGGAAEIAAGETALLMRSDMGVSLDGPRVMARTTLRDAESGYCAISWSGGAPPPDSHEQAERSLEQTGRFWRGWLAAGRFPDHPWRQHLQRSALALKGLIYAPTGAQIAAATTSLPETPGGERNWDYRYTWIRDAAFALWGMHALDFEWEAREFVDFLVDICRSERPEMQVMYGVRGETRLDERTLDHLSGYEGARPVRIGNAAYCQRQHDLYGSLLDAAYIHSKSADHLSGPVWEIVADQVEVAVRVWSEPDQGIWEARGEPKHYVSSKLMCWVALNRGARLAKDRDPERAEHWRTIGERMHAEILERGVSERGVFRQHFETDALDASSLLVPLVRFLPPEDERVVATVEAIAEELTRRGLVLRYLVEETEDGLRGQEATFTICSFWLVSALSEIGEVERARALCERLLTYAGPLLLYGEELDPATGRHWGNYPQAFSHMALINAVSHVISDDLAPPERPKRRSGVLSEFLERR
jgi:GH15 family glucan-1,4-alpha-glucosidase